MNIFQSAFATFSSHKGRLSSTEISPREIYRVERNPRNLRASYPTTGILSNYLGPLEGEPRQFRGGCLYPESESGSGSACLSPPWPRRPPWRTRTLSRGCSGMYLEGEREVKEPSFQGCDVFVLAPSGNQKTKNRSAIDRSDDINKQGTRVNGRPNKAYEERRKGKGKAELWRVASVVVTRPITRRLVRHQRKHTARGKRDEQKEKP